MEIKTYGGAYPITPSSLPTIYAHRTIGLDKDVLCDLVPFVQFKKATMEE